MPSSGSEGDEDHEEFEQLPGEASYVCDSCGEEIIVPIDASGGREQEYVEDCPVCCNPNVIRFEWGHDGGLEMDSEGE
jgi:predicted RNA-binding Zn-ribbon protein involved in translation (DUF1610 family)